LPGPSPIQSSPSECSAIYKRACTKTTAQIIAGSSLQWLCIKMQWRQIMIGMTNKWVRNVGEGMEKREYTK